MVEHSFCILFYELGFHYEAQDRLALNNPVGIRGINPAGTGLVLRVFHVQCVLCVSMTDSASAMLSVWQLMDNSWETAHLPLWSPGSELRYSDLGGKHFDLLSHFTKHTKLFLSKHIQK